MFTLASTEVRGLVATRFTLVGTLFDNERMATPDPLPPDASATLDALRACLDCRVVRRATARLRRLNERRRPLQNRRFGHKCAGRQHRTHVPGCGLVDTLLPTDMLCSTSAILEQVDSKPMEPSGWTLSTLSH